MAPSKSLDEFKLIVTLLHDVFETHEAEFSYKARKNTIKVVLDRASSEGLGFLTKSLPRLGKALDRALAENQRLNAAGLRFSSQSNSQLPRFLGELFNRVLAPDGTVLPDSCAECVKSLRQVLYLFFKYELPYEDEQEQQVIAKFVRTEQELVSTVAPALELIQRACNEVTPTTRIKRMPDRLVRVTRKAKILLSSVFSFFDPTDITPSHGPGAVATKQQLWSKFEWTNISSRITEKYPLDAYFYASLGHFCDDLDGVNRLGEESLPARVVLVPKDSRGPRLISCESVDNQWIQQGLSRAIVELVERHSLTECFVHFTDQLPNRIGALLGSQHGRYSTLDLNEASDRVSLDLVRLLFPPHICEYLEACRSSSTVLPNGQEVALRKFAPMGSSLCFPILALTVWSLLTAAAPDADTRDSILVYGDDVVVPTAYAVDAMSILESFGLKINQDKSCTSGFFRESCGMDAFKGVNVTPVRLRTVWSESRSPNAYESWIAYANSFHRMGYHRVYDYIVEELFRLYGPIPDWGMNLSCPSLRWLPESYKPKRKRWKAEYQTLQYLVLDVKPRKLTHELPGWSMLLRFFTERNNAHRDYSSRSRPFNIFTDVNEPFHVRSYTQRNTSMLVKRWR